MRRRDALVLGGIVAVAVAIPPVLRRIPSDFEFEPLSGFPGFRRVQGGAVSGGVDPFFGLDETARAVQSAPRQTPPCTALFGPEGWQAGVLPIAIFSDFNCPYCKDLEGRLIALRDAGAPIRLIWHEMPLLGPASDRYAQAVLAARFLGVEDAARSLLSQQVLRPGPVGLRRLAEQLGVSPDRLIREAAGPRVAQTVADSLALGRRLGIPGTPGTVVGRTLVVGAIGQADLKKLIELETTEPRDICV